MELYRITVELYIPGCDKPDLESLLIEAYNLDDACEQAVERLKVEYPTFTFKVVSYKRMT